MELEVVLEYNPYTDLVKSVDHWKMQPRAPKGTSEGGRFTATATAALSPEVTLEPPAQFPYMEPPGNWNSDRHGAWSPERDRRNWPLNFHPSMHGALRSVRSRTAHAKGQTQGARMAALEAQKAALAQDSRKQHFDFGSGRWHAPRFQLHQQIMAQAVSQSEDRELLGVYDKFDHSQPVAIFLTGGPASGKTHYKKESLIPHHRFVDIDCDAIKEQLPEYDPGQPMYLHKESVDVAQRLLRHCVKEGRSFTYDSTGLDIYTIQAAAKEARGKGYHIAVHSVEVPVEVALERNQQRARKVPEDLVRSKHSEMDWAFRHLKRLADHVVRHENLSPEEKARYGDWRAEASEASPEEEEDDPDA